MKIQYVIILLAIILENLIIISIMFNQIKKIRKQQLEDIERLYHQTNKAHTSFSKALKTYKLFEEVTND